MFTQRDSVLAIGRELPVGKTDNRTLCFWCEGGRSKERSFAITRTNSYTIKYICHRAKCGRRGTVFLDGSGEDVGIAPSFTPKVYKGPILPLDIHDLEYLDGKYGMDLEKISEAGWCKTDGPGFSLVMPVISPLGELRGHVIRREFKDRPKEVKSYKIIEGNWMCWYRVARRSIVVVEDQISALKAASFCSSVALLGADLTIEKVEEIKKVSRGGTKIWLALDKDASTKSFDYLKRFRSICDGNLFALMLSKDIKNMSYQEISKLGGPFSVGSQ